MLAPQSLLEKKPAPTRVLEAGWDRLLDPRVPPTPARLRWRSKRMAEIRSGEDSVMAHTARLLLTVAFLGGILALPETHAQAPAPAPRTAPETPAPAAQPDIAQLVGDLPTPLNGTEALTPDTDWRAGFLRSLPHPPDQPRSLLEPVPPVTALAEPRALLRSRPSCSTRRSGKKTGWFSVRV